MFKMLSLVAAKLYIEYCWSHCGIFTLSFSFDCCNNHLIRRQKVKEKLFCDFCSSKSVFLRDFIYCIVYGFWSIIHREHPIVLANIWRISLNSWSDLDTWAVCWARGKIRRRFDIIMDSYHQKFLFWCCLFSKYFAFVFSMLVTDKIFIHGSINDRCHLRKHDAERR